MKWVMGYYAADVSTSSPPHCEAYLSYFLSGSGCNFSLYVLYNCHCKPAAFVVLRTGAKASLRLMWTSNMTRGQRLGFAALQKKKKKSINELRLLNFVIVGSLLLKNTGGNSGGQ